LCLKHRLAVAIVLVVVVGVVVVAIIGTPVA